MLSFTGLVTFSFINVTILDIPLLTSTLIIYICPSTVVEILSIFSKAILILFIFIKIFFYNFLTNLSIYSYFSNKILLFVIVVIGLVFVEFG